MSDVDDIPHRVVASGFAATVQLGVCCALRHEASVRDVVLGPCRALLGDQHRHTRVPVDGYLRHGGSSLQRRLKASRTRVIIVTTWALGLRRLQQAFSCCRQLQRLMPLVRAAAR